MKTLLIFILCFALSICDKYSGFNYDTTEKVSREDIFEEIKSTEYGRTLVSTIQINLASNKNENVMDNVMMVTNLVKDVRDGLRKQKERQDKAHREFADSCRNDIGNLDRKINKFETLQTKNLNLQKIDGPVLDDLKKEKAQRKKEQKERESQLAELEAENEKQVQKHEEDRKQHQEVRTMLHQARTIIKDNFKSGVNFLEIQSQAFGKFSSVIRSFNPSKQQGLAHGYTHIFNVLAVIAEREPKALADQYMIDTLLRIFDDVEDNLEASLDRERTAERLRLEAFTEITDRLKYHLLNTANRVQELVGQVQNLQLAVTQYEENIENTQEQIDNAKTLKKDRQSVCKEEDAQFQQANNNISDQIGICSNAVYLMEDKRDLLYRYIDN